MGRIILFLFAFSLLSIVAQAAEPAKSETTTDTILVFDASGSMWAQIDGINKIVIARDVVSDLLRELPASHRMGLIAYGHNRKGDCSDIEMLAPVGTDLDKIAATVQSINPKGMTPMTDAVIQAAEALKYTENEATVILVSDGEETCHADPCEAARRLAELGVGLTVHTVGFGLESAEAEAAEQQLQCMAEATGGQSFMAHNAEELTAALTRISQAETEPEPEPEPEPQAPATVEVKLTATDQEGGPVIEDGLVWTIHHGASGDELYQSEPGGSVTVDLPKGVHDVSVVRLEDEASAEGEIVTGADGTHVTLPIIVAYDVTLEAPEQAVVGSRIRVTWTGPEDDGDYIGIATLDGNPRWSAESTSIDQGNPLLLQVPAEPGEYRIVYVRKVQGYAALAERPFEAIEAESSVSAPDTAIAGESISVEWSGPEYDGDYIAIAKIDDNPRWPAESTRIDQGSPLQVQVPAEPGDYRVAYVMKHGYRALAEQPLEVTATQASISAPETATAGETLRVQWTGPEHDGDYIGIVKTDGNPRWSAESTPVDQGSPLQVRVPAEPGDYRIVYVMKQGYTSLAEQPLEVTATQASISAPETATAGETLHVQWTGPEHDGDYIGIVKTDGNPRWSAESTPVDQGSPLQVRVPAEPGDYRIVYVMKQGYTSLAEQPFTVAEVESSVSAPATATAGEAIRVQWTGPEYDGDYIGIVALDGSPRWSAKSTPVDQGNPLQLQMPGEAGDYRVVYVMKHGYRALAEQPIQVVPE